MLRCVAKNHLLCFALAVSFAVRVAAAAEYHGTVTFGGLPVPGATITATQDGKKFSAVTDLGGLYHFDDLPNGQWTIEVEMQGFVAIHTPVNISTDTPAGKWELSLLPADQLMARSKAQKNPIVAQPALVAPAPAAATTHRRQSAVRFPGPGNIERSERGRIPGERQREQCSHFALLHESCLRKYACRRQGALQRRACGDSR